jgi:N6-L-threonylcarbamoyladenine synthase/tRNA threonylcarbamoyladenosine biosynthesis protein TsaB
MLILAVDTSGSNCSCALLQDDILIGETNVNYDKQHSVVLMPMMAEMFQRVNLKPADLTHLAVDVGPGSFTGLRIGISVLKAMSQALQIPLYSFDSFAVYAEAVKYFQGAILTVSDALRSTFYTRLFQSDGRELTPLSGGEVRDMEEIKDLLAGPAKAMKLLITGDGLVKQRTLFAAAFPEAALTDNRQNLAYASALAKLAQVEILGEVAPEGGTTPLYMRKPQAVREYEAKHGKFNDNI